MPLRNNMFGVYKLLMIGSQYVVVDSASRDRKMDVSSRPLVQGTAKTRVLDIGGLHEDITIEAPILIGGGAAIDGRQLINSAISNAMDPNNTTLPVLTSANISITQEAAKISIGMKSDGRPSAQAFSISGIGADGIAGQPLNPSASGGPTRLGRFYDFRVNLGGYVYYIISVTIQIKVTVTEKYFIPGNDGTTGPTNPMDSTDSNNPYYFGTQFPYMGVSGIQISGSGQAAVQLVDSNGNYDYNDPGDANVNVSLSTDKTGYELTYQLPGQAVPSSAVFEISVWNPTAQAYQSLFANANIDLSKSITKAANFRISPGLLTNDFQFECWVK